MIRVGVLVLAATVAWPSADAAVTDSAANGFTVEHSVTAAASAETVWAALINDVGKWWHPDHSFSQNAANLSINAVPLGCFCERLPNGGSVVHMTVTFVQPKEMLRLTGGLGPLGLMGVDGNMTISVIATTAGTRLQLVYSVGGYSADGLDQIAAAVDGVLGEQMTRLATFAESGRPTR
ncbi:MAG: SRPBCC family protein [Pseudomonadota bacterium]